MILLRIEDLTMENSHDAIDLCISPKSVYKQARAEKLRWLESRLPNLAGGKLAYFDDEPAGMIEFSIIEDAPLPVSGNWDTTHQLPLGPTKIPEERHRQHPRQGLHRRDKIARKESSLSPRVRRPILHACNLL